VVAPSTVKVPLAVIFVLLTYPVASMLVEDTEVTVVAPVTVSVPPTDTLFPMVVAAWADNGRTSIAPITPPRKRRMENPSLSRINVFSFIECSFI
jgi:hypothetical protein